MINRRLFINMSGSILTQEPKWASFWKNIYNIWTKRWTSVSLRDSSAEPNHSLLSDWVWSVWYGVLLHLFGHVCDDGFGARLKDQLSFDECLHWVRGGVLPVRFHGIVMAVLRMAWVLHEDGERFVQFDLLPVQNVMSNDEHWHPLVEEIWTAASTKSHSKPHNKHKPAQVPAVALLRNLLEFLESKLIS